MRLWIECKAVHLSSKLQKPLTKPTPFETRVPRNEYRTILINVSKHWYYLITKISKELFYSVIRENPDAAIELIRILAVRLANNAELLSKVPVQARH